MEAHEILIVLFLAGASYGLGFFSCALLSMGCDLQGDAARHAPACAVIDALSKQVRRYRLAVVWVFVLMFVALLLTIGSNWA